MFLTRFMRTGLWIQVVNCSIILYPPYQIIGKTPNGKLKMKLNKIPKILHQTWKGHDLPEKFRNWQRSWIHHHPDWEHRFYTDNDCTAFIRKVFPGWLDIYEQYREPVQRADLFRYLVIYHCGGLYADMDMKCFKSIDSLLGKKSCLFSIEAYLTNEFQKELDYPKPFQVANCIFAAGPNHPFLEHILKRVKVLSSVSIQNDNDVEESTGPRMLTRLFFSIPVEIGSLVTLLPQINLMSPSSYPNIFPINLNMYARHHCSGTWKKDKKKLSLKRRLIERNRLPGLW